MSESGTAQPARELEVRADLIEGIYSHIPRSSLGVLGGAATVAWGMWGQVSHPALVIWLGAIVAILAWRLALFRAYRLSANRRAAVGRWEKLWTLSTGMHASVWGSSAFFMFVHDSPEYQALLLVALFAICTAAVPLVGRHLPSLYSFVLPTLVPITLRLALEGTAARFLLAVISCLVMYGIFLFGRELNRTITEAVRRRYENLDLIAELQAQKARAEAAHETADRANRMKSRFLAAASHDLRQPLHALALFSASLRQRVQGSEHEALVGNVCQSVSALDRMFDALLDFSRLDAGGVQPRPHPFALQSLFDRIAREWEAEAAAKGIALGFVRTTAIVLSDPFIVERILRNLVVNALRYTPQGRVLVGCRRRGGRVCIEVWDTGIGIASQDQSRIFEEFVQITSSDGDRRSGLGLGLATVRRMAALLEAPLSVESWPGKGSVFRVSLARSTAIPVEEPGEQGLTDARPAHVAGSIVLVIDDDPAALAAMRTALEVWGARAVTASSIDEALARLAECERYPDAIVSDLRLGTGENGIEAIARIRNELGLALPGLIVSGDTATASIREIEASALPHLAKPVAAERLHAALDRLLAGDRAGGAIAPEATAARAGVRR